MNNLSSLRDLKQGQVARVRALKSKGSIRRRLMDIGLIEGTEVECLQHGPAGEPIAYLIRGAVIALRGEDSSNVIVYA